MLRNLSIVSLVVGSLTAVAGAQPDPAEAEPDPAGAPAPLDPAAPPPPGDPVAMTAPTVEPPPPRRGATLRNGFSLSVGQEFGTSNIGNRFSGQLYGFDWRIGMQINKAIGVYLHTHLSLGSIKTNAVSGYTGNLAAAVTGEYTLPMRLFLAAGAGYGVLNNPSGPLVGFRVGYYPFEATSAGKSRRLNVALDTRLYFVSAGAESITMKHIAVSIGYDRF